MQLYESETWYRTALEIATRLHAGQVDKNGKPYIDHLVRTAGHLADMFPDWTRDEIEAALIHDVFEDTSAEPSVLVEAGVSPQAIYIAQQLSKPSGADYKQWMAWLCCNVSTSALRVKLADNRDNRDPARNQHPSRQHALVTKYLPAKAIIEGELSRREAVVRRARLQEQLRGEAEPARTPA